MKGLTVLITTVLLFPNLFSKRIQESKFAFLEQYNGLYAYNVKLMTNPKIKHALIGLAGPSGYNFIKTNCGVESPIEVKDGIFTATACQAHNCGDTNFILVINIPGEKVFAGIRNNGQVKIYPEGASSVPQIASWAQN